MTVEEARKLWIEALRSGDYRQTRNYLHRSDPISGDSFCCLGVACKLAVENGIGLDVERDGTVVRYNGAESGLPHAVRNWLGLYSGHGGRADYSLTTLNDNGRSFEYIADIIENDPAGLFVEGDA